jgi:hypothetical protein
MRLSTPNISLSGAGHSPVRKGYATMKDSTSNDLSVADQFRFCIPADEEPALAVTPESLHALDEVSDLFQGGPHIAALGGRVCKLRDDLLI